MCIDPTVWIDEEDAEQGRHYDDLIAYALLCALFLLIGGISFWLGRVTA